MSSPALTLANAYFHTLDGVLLPISGPIAIRFYGLSYVLGFVLAFVVLYTLARKGKILVPAHRVLDLMLLVVLGTLLGGRIGYILFYETTPWSQRLASFYKVWEGGMASHGGMVGIILACIIASRGFKARYQQPDGSIITEREGQAPALHIMDLMALTAPIGLFVGRLANFVNGELLGKIVAPAGEPGPWWAVKFPQELLGWQAPGLVDVKSHTPPLSADQLRQLDALVMSVKQPSESWHEGLKYVVSHAGKYAQQLEPLVSSRHPSQIYQALAEGLVLGVVMLGLWLFTRAGQRPGVLTGVWLMLYGILRVVTEFWRLPDPQFTGESARPLLGLFSRGQSLSLLMIAGGGVVLGWVVFRGRQMANGKFTNGK